MTRPAIPAGAASRGSGATISGSNSARPSNRTGGCGGAASGGGTMNQLSRQAAQRTFRPIAPIRSGSSVYSLAQDGQTMIMTIASAAGRGLPHLSTDVVNAP